MEFKHILIPINIDQSHWVLVDVELKRRRISYFDSLASLNEHNGISICTILIRFFDDYLNTINNGANDNLNNNLNLIVDITNDKIDEETTNTNKVLIIC